MWILSRVVVLTTLLLTISCCAQSSEAQIQLEIEPPKTAVPLGQPFLLRIQVTNRSQEGRELLPIFLLSPDHLWLGLRRDGAIEPLIPTGTIDWKSVFRRFGTTRLGPGQFVGTELEISPVLENSFNHLAGLGKGCYRLTATMSLRNTEDLTKNSDERDRIFSGLLEAPEREICFTGAIEASVQLYQDSLQSDDLSTLLESLRYFSNVKSPGVTALILRKLGSAKGWIERFPDPYYALAALRKQGDSIAKEYFRAALGTRF